MTFFGMPLVTLGLQKHEKDALQSKLNFRISPRAPCHGGGEGIRGEFGTSPLALVAAPSVHRDPFKMLRKWLQHPSQKNKPKAKTLCFHMFIQESFIPQQINWGYIYIHVAVISNFLSF